MHGLWIAALVAGASYSLAAWFGWGGPAVITWKGAGVGLLALWAALPARKGDQLRIAGVLGLGALGDVLLNAVGLQAGAIAFLAGHCLAIWLYLRNRVGSPWLIPVAAILVSASAMAVAGPGPAAEGIGLYATGLGAMAGAALASRFPLAGIGALLFVGSDLLIFASSGMLADSPLPRLLVWPLYFAGQALIAHGVVRTLARDAGWAHP